jgi:hypothetical protein
MEAALAERVPTLGAVHLCRHGLPGVSAVTVCER